MTVPKYITAAIAQCERRLNSDIDQEEREAIYDEIDLLEAEAARYEAKIGRASSALIEEMDDEEREDYADSWYD